jgi:hypothetical protein
MRTKKVSLTQQHERLAGLLVELEKTHGPADLRVLAEVRQEWPARQDH